MRLLVLDAYAKAGREALAGAGGTVAGTLYRDLLQRLAPGVAVDVAHPADGPLALPEGRGLSDYAGFVWTGSSLTIHEDEDPAVRRQVELAREIYDRGTPSFGSCWAAQLAVVASGGACAASPRGREFGVSRDIALSEAGAAHPLYADKPRRFVAFTSHADEVVTLSPEATRLASNPWSDVQAVGVTRGGGFWAVQYHPEYDCHEVASLARLRRDELIAQGTFADGDEADRFVDDLEALHLDPTRRDLAARLGLDESVLDEDVRTVEVRNWLARLATAGG